MIISKYICFALAAVLILFSFAGCQKPDTDITTAAADEPGNIYDFESCANDNVFNIEKIDLSEVYGQKCETYRFFYLSDGYKVEAYISIPLSAIDSQKPAKCIMYNHGGNNDLGTLEDNTTAFVCSSLDRIVIASQYRGCVSSQGRDDFGGDNLNDVINLIDLCEDHFKFIDMDDFCVAGVSRGGVMTYPAARKDSRIKRIIAISAISDLIASYNSRNDDMKLVLLECIGCSPEEDPEEYEKRSAIYWADEIKVPVLIFHSKSDALVSYSQAEALYEKLKDSTDCTLISHDDDLHGLHPVEDIPAIKNWLNDN